MTKSKEQLQKLKDAICEMVCIVEDAVDRERFKELDNAGADIIDCLDELEGYREIGTAEEFKALKAENAELHNEAQAERALLDKRDAEVRAKAIDDFMKKICEKYTEEEKRRNYKQYCGAIKNELADIAEQLKGGAVNE